MLLGVTDTVARQLALAYWLVQYQQLRQMADDPYLSLECRPKGRFDEGLQYPPWNLEQSYD